MTMYKLSAGEGRRIQIRNGEIFLKTVGSETGGHVGVFEQVMEKGHPGPVPHFHKLTTEMFFIVDGALNFTLDDSNIELSAGEFLRVPPNTIHSFAQTGAIPTRFLIMFSPGGQREGYFEGLASMAAEPGDSDREKLVDLMHEYDQYLADEYQTLDENY